ncbi:MAG: hypothetical protein A2030_02040 [Chloroflexi bacterium RBG_19FT_COMBO_50_10]|nr:MAG: hypothetical protein A2030_02040 [Chloroflexi bacterium RBG_19FT_COMBO_50_10]
MLSGLFSYRIEGIDFTALMFPLRLPESITQLIEMLDFAMPLAPLRLPRTALPPHIGINGKVRIWFSAILAPLIAFSNDPCEKKAGPHETLETG